MLPLIFIPSKGRPEGNTMKMLKELQVRYMCVIEEPEKELYSDHDVAILPEVDKGIGYSRAWIATNVRFPFLMLDDDIKVCYERLETGVQQITLKELLEKLVAFGNEHDVAVVGCQHTFFGCNSKKYVLNTGIGHILYIKDRVEYDAEKRCFEDVDMLMTCIRKKRNVAKVCSLVYFSTPSGTNKKGGVDYSNELKMKEMLKMKEKYGDMFEILEGTTRFGQPKYRVHWKKLQR